MTWFWLWLAVLSLLPLLLAWVLYPVAMRWLARRRPVEAPAGSPDTAPLISIILATREPPEAVRARVDDLARSTYPSDRREIVVAIDGDPAGYAEALGPERPGVRVVAGDPPGGKAAALNAGVRASAGSLLLFADTYQRFDPPAVTQLVHALTGGPYGAVSGALELSDAAAGDTLVGRYWRAEKRLRAAEARLHSAVGVTGAIYGMRRALWQPLPAGLILDDLYLPMRLVLEGQRIGFTEAARAFDQRRPSARQELRRKARTLTGNLQLCAWLPAVLSPRRNPIWVQFLCHKLLRLLTPYCLTGLGIGALGLLLTRRGGGLILLGLALLVAAALVAAPGGRARRLREALLWGLAMQLAIVQASWRGLRGRWDVWDPSR